MKTEDFIFESNFDSTMQILETSAQDPAFTIERVRNELESLYKYEGLDWTGRGELKNAEIGGSIMAYQIFLKKWNDRAGSAVLKI